MKKTLLTDSLFFAMLILLLCSLCPAQTRSKTVTSSCWVSNTSATNKRVWRWSCRAE